MDVVVRFWVGMENNLARGQECRTHHLPVEWGALVVGGFHLVGTVSCGGTEGEAGRGRVASRPSLHINCTGETKARNTDRELHSDVN